MLNQKLDQHINSLQELVLALTNRSAVIYEDIKIGETENGLYNDYFEFLNYQLSQVESVINLANQSAYRESFVIIRSLFEHMTLFTLMTVCRKYYRFFRKAGNNRETYDQIVERWNKEIESARRKGQQTNALEAVKYEGKNSGCI